MKYDYNDMPLDEEIRRCLSAHRGMVHPVNISRWIVNDRQERSLDSNIEPAEIQSLTKITRQMSKMNDIEVVRVGNRYYRRFKKQGKLTRGIQWLLPQLRKLSFIKGVMSKILSRLKYRKPT